MADDKHILTPLMDWLRAASVKESKGVTNTMVPWFLEFLVAAESAYATALLNGTFRPPPVPPEGPPNKRLRGAGGMVPMHAHHASVVAAAVAVAQTLFIQTNLDLEWGDH